MSPTKEKTHKTAQKRAEKQDVTHIQNKLFLCVLDTIRFLKTVKSRGLQIL